ncbi:MAG: hypothetical protein AABX17_00425 [Nanoarchaeota archaeon]
MSQQQIDAKYVKERLVKYLDEKGPSLPVNLAKHVGLNSLFTSAFLSELSEEGHLKISDMKVGGSPLYYPKNKVAMLENFMNHLDSKDREACLLLKEKMVLDDQKQTPIVRVALRGLKDFAVPIKKDEKLYWRYFLVNEDVALEKLFPTAKPIELIPEIKIEPKKEEPETKLQIKQEKEIDKINNELEEKRKELEKLKSEILNFPKLKKDSKKPEVLKKEPKKKAESAKEKFLSEIKETLDKKSIELVNVEQYDKKQVFARIKIRNVEYLLAAYDKKKVEASDIMRAYKKSLALDLPYYIISKGDTSKKTKEVIEAYKKLAAIESFEDNAEQ